MPKKQVLYNMSYKSILSQGLSFLPHQACAPLYLCPSTNQEERKSREECGETWPGVRGSWASFLSLLVISYVIFTFWVLHIYKTGNNNLVYKAQLRLMYGKILLKLWGLRINVRIYNLDQRVRCCYAQDIVVPKNLHLFRWFQQTLKWGCNCPRFGT